MPESILLYTIAALDIALFASMVVGFDLYRRHSVVQITNLREAFEFLESRLKRAFPDLREGFTWKEAMMKVRSLHSSADWPEIDIVLKKYQALRYGEEDPGDVKVDSIVRLAKALPRGSKK